jgi:ribose-phosphate pyrophosphokinase
MPDDLCLFALSESRDLGQSIADALGHSLSEHVERDFDDGEHILRPAVNVRGRDVFVIQSLYDGPTRSVNDKLCRLLFFLGALRDAAAARVTAVLPYLCYQRKDRKTQPRDPVTTRYLAGLFESVEVDRVLTMDVHNLAAYQNAFRCRTDHLKARPLFVERIAALAGDRDVVAVSPDEGGVKRVNRFAEGLRVALGREVPTAFVEKLRANGVVSGGTLVGAVEGRLAVIVDDLIGTGTTVRQAVRACMRNGAQSVVAAATHGVFVGRAPETLQMPALASVFVTNTIPPFRLSGTAAAENVTVCDVSARFARAVEAIHAGGSVTQLNEMPPAA